MTKPRVAWDTTNPIWSNPEFPASTSLGNKYIPVPLIISNDDTEPTASVKIHIFIEDKDGNRVGTHEANRFITSTPKKVVYKVYTNWLQSRLAQDMYVKAYFDGNNVLVGGSPRVTSPPIYAKLVLGQRWTSIQNAPAVYLDTQGNTLLPEADSVNSVRPSGGYGSTTPIDIPESAIPQTPPSPYDLDSGTVTQALPPAEPSSGYNSGLPTTASSVTTGVLPQTSQPSGNWLQNLFASIFGRRTQQQAPQSNQGLRLPWT